MAGIVPYSHSLIEGLRELTSEPLCREWAEDIVSFLEQRASDNGTGGTRYRRAIPETVSSTERNAATRRTGEDI